MSSTLEMEIHMRNLIAAFLAVFLLAGLTACKNPVFDFPPAQGGYTGSQD
jgi:predicted small lipoprotein YifL